MINRAAILLRYKKAAVDWINKADPYPDSLPMTLADANEERTVYLITDQDAESAQNVEKWLEKNYRELFEAELEGWYNDPTIWPEKRSLKLFKSWFSVECHTVLIDTVGAPIFDDET